MVVHGCAGRSNHHIDLNTKTQEGRKSKGSWVESKRAVVNGIHVLSIVYVSY